MQQIEVLHFSGIGLHFSFEDTWSPRLDGQKWLTIHNLKAQVRLDVVLDNKYPCVPVFARDHRRRSVSSVFLPSGILLTFVPEHRKHPTDRAEGA